MSIRFERVPNQDKRFGRGDDYAGDAWRDTETGKVFWVTVGYTPTSDGHEALATDKAVRPQPSGSSLRAIVASLLLVLAVAACASQPDAPQPEPSRCVGYRCQTQQERVQEEIRRAEISALRRALREAQNIAWRAMRGR